MQRRVLERKAGYRLLAGLVGTLLYCLISVTGALAAGDVNQPACSPETESSPGFRTYLPDCRAYEMVTPTFKNGSELQLSAISENGSDVLGHSLSGFAGIENNSNSLDGGVYELSRSSSGWTVSPISPSSFSFPAQEWLAASPDLTSTLWLARAPFESAGAENIYIREADGTMREIGPLLPPAAVAGPASGDFQAFEHNGNVQVRDASAALSHVLYDIHSPLRHGLSWPSDGTIGQFSLYEYSGTGASRPELVGVSDGSTIVAGENEGKPLPAGHLISACSTYLGSAESADLYNAVSEDGATVFFTAAKGCTEEGLTGEGPEVNELYARLDQQETVPISEPTTGAFGGCSNCKDTGRRQAEFAGASRDGSKVFFLTEQELLPGAVGMNLYEYDFDAPAGGHVIQASVGSAAADVLGVVRVSEDGSHAYFVATGKLTGGANRDGAEPVQGQPNLYMFERDAIYPAGHVAFIATLSPSDEEDWLASDGRQAQATPDGRFLVFQSRADLTVNDTSSVAQVFEYDAATGELVCISREEPGYSPPEARLSANENSSAIPFQGYFNRTLPTAASTHLAVSEDGATVMFDSTGALTVQAEEAAAAGVRSVYEYRSSVADGGSISAGEVYLISDGTNVLETPEPPAKGLDASGQDVFFAAGDSLLPTDTDTQFDTYDAHINGGFPGPDSPAGCEACTSDFAEPSFVPPASTDVNGTGDVAAPPPASSVMSKPPTAKIVRCRKSDIRKKGKCKKRRRLIEKPVARPGSIIHDRETGR
jgi:hypothetical protein